MSKFDDVLVNAKDVATTAGSKINEGVSVVKIKFQIAKIESEIKNEYKLIGTQYYLSKKNPDVAFNPEKNVDNIDFYNQELETLKEKLADLKSLKRCDICSNYVPKDSEFCPKCGNKF